MSRYSKLGKNVVLITMGNFSSKILSFFLIPLYTAVLTTEEFGIADLMTTTINLISPFFTFLISEAIMRFALEKDVDKSEVLGIGLITTFSGFIVMLLFSPLILLSDSLKPFYFLFIVYYFAVTIHTAISQFVKGLEKVGIYSLAGVAQTICFISLNLILLLVVKSGVSGYLIALIGSHLFSTIILWIGAKINTNIPSKITINKNLFRDMLKYSIPLIPNSLSWWVSNSADKYILTFFCGLSITGIYSVSQRIPSMFSIISTIFMSAWQISAIEDFGSEQSRQFFGEIYRSYSSLNNIVVSVLICLTRIIAGFLFSKDFYQGWEYVPILVAAYLFYAMAGFLGTIYTAAKKTKMVFISTVISALTNIILNLILIPIWGGIGAAVATFFSYFVVWLVRLIDSRKIIIIEINIIKDVLAYIIIFVQILLLLQNNTIGFIISAFLIFGMCTLYIKEIIKYLSIIGKAIKKGIKDNEG